MMIAPVAGSSPPRPPAVPTKTSPLAYTGDEKPSAPTVVRQATASFPTVERPSTFSYGSKQLRPLSKQAWSQSVRTRKTASDTSPLETPTAPTTWSPGIAEAGILIPLPNAPFRPAVAEAIRVESKESATVSPGENPEPVARATDVGGPMPGSSVSAAWSDARGEAPAGPATTATRSAASSVATKGS